MFNISAQHAALVAVAMVEYALTLKCVSAPVAIKDSTVKLVSLVRTEVQTTWTQTTLDFEISLHGYRLLHNCGQTL